MDSVATNIRFRDLMDSDLDAVACLMNSYEPYGMTGDILRQRTSQWKETDPLMRLVVEGDNKNIVAYGRSMRRQSEPHGIFRVSTYVDKEFSGLGIGCEMFRRVQSFAKEKGGGSILTTVEESCDRGLKFAERSGMEKIQRLFESRLDLKSFDPSAHMASREKLRSEGIVFTTLGDLGNTEESWRKLFEIDNITDQDTPGSENWSLGTFEEYYQQHAEAHGFTPDGMQIATLNGSFIGVNFVKASTIDGEWHTEYTGVLRKFRGRGLAYSLKTLGAAYAKNNGAAVMVTNNDERNAPMLAVNKKLGFVAQPGFFVMKKSL